MNDQLLTVVLLLAGGLVLVATEVFVIPGFGVIGIIGGVVLMVASIMSWIWFDAPGGAIALLISVLGPALLFYVFAKSRAGQRLVLQTALPKTPPSAAVHVGQVGVALTPLRPAGTAQFAGTRVDVVTDGQYVNAGEPLRVIELSGGRVVVEKAPTAPDITRNP
jgi:membrane-bound serine protease (ClpP class)